MNNDVDTFLASHPYAETTIRTYKFILNRLITEYDPAIMTAINLVTFVRKQEWGNSRQCVALAASQKFIGWKYGATHAAMQAKIKRIVGKPQRALDNNNALKLLASFNPHVAKGARDLALCALALDTGLRCSELCRLALKDVDLNHNSLEVIVKGGKWAAAVFAPQTGAHISQWLAFRKTNGDSLFTNTWSGKQLTPEGLNSIVKQWGRVIGIKLSPHDLRRTFATIATEAGAPERILMEGGRWSNSQMIQRYTRSLKLEGMRKYLPTLRIGNT